MGAYEAAPGRWVHYGLAVGSADLIGWYPLVIKPEHVGRTVAVFLSVETKRPKGRTAKDRLEKQRNWRNAVQAAGGIALFADNEQALEAALKQYLQ